MKFTQNVSLKNICLRAPIGLFPEEKVNGNDFEIDVEISCKAEKENQFPFVDYSLIAETVQDVFSRPADLLEDAIQEIFAQLKKLFPTANRYRVAVRKLKPPLPGKIECAEVEFIAE